MAISKKLGKLFVGLNLAIVIRALRFGLGDAKERLARAFRDIDPFAKKSGDSSPVPAALLLEDRDEGPPSIDAEWDQTVALSRQEAGPLSYNKPCNIEDF